MRIFCHIPRENWFADRFGSEFQKYSAHEISHIELNCDVIWLLASWCWRQIPPQILQDRKVVCTIHHEVPEKFDQNRENEFKLRDKFVDVYHVPCEQTRKFISEYTDKPIAKLGYWCNNYVWHPMSREKCKKELDLPAGKFFVGSFQRDTEGSDLRSPKLEKGPDRFCDYIEKLNHEIGNVHVLLNGWRRQYVISRLEKAHIPYTYTELPDIDIVAKMYAACDLYVVASRYEGGPQAVLEAPAMNIPIVSSNVGMATDVIPSNCILDFDTSYNLYHPTDEDISIAHQNAKKYFIETQIKKYDNFFEDVVRL